MRDDSSRLVRRCIEGDRLAHNELYRRLMPALLGVCRLYLKNREDVEDTLNEAFACIFHGLGTYHGSTMAELAKWANAVTTNKAIDKIRYNSSPRRYGVNVPIEHGTAYQSEDIEGSIDTGLIASIADGLPRKQRMVFRMHDIDGYDYSEIAETLGMSEVSVRVNDHRARKWVAERLEADARRADSYRGEYSA